MFAPGAGITSLGIRNDRDVVTMPGTSMATPHVSGVAACFIVENQLRNPHAIGNMLLNNATYRNLVNGSSGLGFGSPNIFLHNGSNLQ